MTEPQGKPKAQILFGIQLGKENLTFPCDFCGNKNDLAPQGYGREKDKWNSLGTHKTLWAVLSYVSGKQRAQSEDGIN